MIGRLNKTDLASLIFTNSEEEVLEIFQVMIGVKEILGKSYVIETIESILLSEVTPPIAKIIGPGVTIIQEACSEDRTAI